MKTRQYLVKAIPEGPARFRQWLWTFVILAILACPVLPGQVEAAGDYNESRCFSLQFLSGLLYSPVIENSHRYTFNYSLTALRLSYILTGMKHEDSLLRGNLELLSEAVYSSVTKGAGDFMAGMTFLLRYNFIRPDAPIIPYIQVGAGVVYNDIYKDMSQNLIGQAIEFTPQAGLGIHFLLNKDWSVDLEAMFHHVSNAGLDGRNVGVNALGGLLLSLIHI